MRRFWAIEGLRGPLIRPIEAILFGTGFVFCWGPYSLSLGACASAELNTRAEHHGSCLERPSLDPDIGAAPRGKVGEDPADQARELEPVAAAWAGDDHIIATCQEIDDEPLLRLD